MTHQPADRYATTAAETTTVLAGIAAVIVIVWAIAGHWPDWLIAAVVFVGTPLGCLGVWVTSALATRARQAGRSRRLRLQLRSWPYPALVITDTPQPACPDCQGYGGWIEDYADHDGEYGGTTTVMCDCWTTWQRSLLALPRPLANIRNRHIARRWTATARRSAAGYSQEPPF